MSHPASPPPEGYLASLAGFDRMTTARLSSLLAHHDPVAAFHVAVGDASPPPPGIGALWAKDHTLAEVWRRSGRLRDPAACWQRCVDTGTAVIAHGDPRYPAPLFDDPRRRRCCSSAVTCRCPTLVASGSSAPATPPSGDVRRPPSSASSCQHVASPSCPAWRRASTVPPTAAPSRDPGARPVAVVGNGPDAPYPKQHASLWAEVSARGAVDVRVAARHASRRVPLPAPQPHPGRARRGARGRREPGARREPDHREGGSRAWRRAVRGTGSGRFAGVGRDEPTAVRRCRTRYAASTT